MIGSHCTFKILNMTVLVMVAIGHSFFVVIKMIVTGSAASPIIHSNRINQQPKITTEKEQRKERMLRQLRNTTLKAVGTVFIVGTTIEVTTKLPSEGRSSQIYHLFSDEVVTPLLRKALEPEDAHNIALYFLQKGFAPTFRPNVLESNSKVNLSIETKDGLVFPSCVGLAAGFDKDGVAIQNLMDLGFGFVEIGSVTPKPQPGNPKPRMFRLLEDGGIINRFGFNSVGVDEVEENLKSFKRNTSLDTKSTDTSSPSGFLISILLSTWNLLLPPFPTQPKSLLGVNLGKNKTSTKETEDYEIGIERLGKYADYLVVNISSPNTPGLRSLQQSEPIRRLLMRCIEKRDSLPENKCGKKPPLFVKIAPDLSDDEMKDIADAVLEYNIDGMLVTNTSNQRPKSLVSKHSDESGGLSGSPIRELSTECIRKMYKLTKGNVFIIGIGGVGSGQDAFEKIKAGASVVQIYSRMAYEGPGIVSRIRKELAEILQQNGHREILDAVGMDHEEIYWQKKMDRAKKSIENESIIVDF